MVYIGPFFFHFCILLVIFQFKMAPKHNAEVLSCIPKHRKAVLYLTERTHALDQLRWGLRYSVAGWEFSDNEVITYIQHGDFKHGDRGNCCDQRLIETQPCISPRQRFRICQLRARCDFIEHDNRGWQESSVFPRDAHVSPGTPAPHPSGHTALLSTSPGKLPPWFSQSGPSLWLLVPPPSCAPPVGASSFCCCWTLGSFTILRLTFQIF